jgi:hypothetical protein
VLLVGADYGGADAVPHRVCRSFAARKGVDPRRAPTHQRALSRCFSHIGRCCDAQSLKRYVQIDISRLRGQHAEGGSVEEKLRQQQQQVAATTTTTITTRTTTTKRKQND